MKLEDLGIVGNCQFAALIHADGSIVWCCLPRFDSEPVFSTLLDSKRGGSFRIHPPSGEPGVQRYIENTNVLETRFRTEAGSFRILDFAPRYLVGATTYRPTVLVRIVEPLEGTPSIQVHCDPKLGWSATPPSVNCTPGFTQFGGFESQLRLTHDSPVPLDPGKAVPLTAKRYFLLSWGEPPVERVQEFCETTLARTTAYWVRWVSHTSLPLLHQRQVIRSALVLKLHCCEETGAIIASVTTSIPEAPGTGRTWDYRYCWLRDAYYVISAFRLLGHFEERQQFIHFLLNLLGPEINLFGPYSDLQIAPVYRIDGSSKLEERVLTEWQGFQGERPVRTGNAAVHQRQNDVYGELVLALAPVFLDERYVQDRSPELLDALIRLTRKAVSVAGTPDAGIWELREQAHAHTFSSLMAWAACDRMARIGQRHGLADRNEFAVAAERLQREILVRAWSPSLSSLTATYGGSTLDASLLQAVTLRLLPPTDERMHHMVEAISRDLNRNGWLLRYRIHDDIGVPSTAFTICTFWLVEALCVLGESVRARNILAKIFDSTPPLGLLAEDWDPASGTMWGNFPQTYSHAGIVRSAFASSPHWTEWL